MLHFTHRRWLKNLIQFLFLNFIFIKWYCLSVWKPQKFFSGNGGILCITGGIMVCIEYQFAKYLHLILSAFIQVHLQCREAPPSPSTCSPMKPQSTAPLSFRGSLTGWLPQRQRRRQIWCQRKAPRAPPTMTTSVSWRLPAWASLWGFPLSFHFPVTSHSWTHFRLCAHSQNVYVCVYYSPGMGSPR